MLTLWIIWAVLTLAVITLAVYRKVAARTEDDYVHLAESESRAISEQVTVARKLDRIDYWGKTLTVVDLGFLVVLLGLAFYNAWHTSMDSMK